MVWIRERFLDIEGREGHEYIRLEERYQKLEEPEWKSQESKYTSPEWWDDTSEIHDDRDHDGTDEYIEKETKREWTDSDEFSDEVEPTDHDIDHLLEEWIPREMPEIMAKMLHWSFHDDTHGLSDEYDRERHEEGRAHIRVYWPEVSVKRWYDDGDDVQYETEDVPEEYHDSKPTKKPHVFPCLPLVFEKSCDIGKHTGSDIEAECLHTWHLVGMERAIEESYEYEEEHHEYPSREDRVGDIDSEDIPSWDSFSFRGWDMWTGVSRRISMGINVNCLTRHMCRYSMFRCSHGIRDEWYECEKRYSTIDNSCNHSLEIGREYIKTRFFCKRNSTENKKSSMEEDFWWKRCA